MDLHKEIGQWLFAFRLIPGSSPALSPNAQLSDLVAVLRDGVVLCQLVHSLDPSSVDMTRVLVDTGSEGGRAVSDFLCRNNIFLFLHAIVANFNLDRDRHFFDPEDLYLCKNVARVFGTLSVLSHSPKVRKSGVPGFPKKEKQLAKKLKREMSNYEELNRIYGEAETEFIYDSFSLPHSALQQDFYHNEGIYQTIFPPKAPRLSLLGSTKRNKRQAPMNELVDTEDKYLENLIMVRDKFREKLTLISNLDKAIIFYKLDDLIILHSDMLFNLKQKRADVGLALLKHLPRLSNLYGLYCVNLPQAVERLEQLSETSVPLKKLLLECQSMAQPSTFPLSSHLVLPFQRFLKYHLLLKEILKLTPEDHPERPNLELAVERMLEACSEVNERKREHEEIEKQNLQDDHDVHLIKNVAQTIKLMRLENGLNILDYGRLRKAGDIVAYTEYGGRTPSDYAFLFDTMIVLCHKPKWLQHRFRFREAVKIKDNFLEPPDLAPKLDSLFPIRLFSRVDARRITLTLVARTEAERFAWFAALLTAMDAVNPAENALQGHVVQLTTFPPNTDCFHCFKRLHGKFYQGYRCLRCQANLHKICLAECACLEVGTLTKSNSVCLPRAAREDDDDVNDGSNFGRSSSTLSLASPGMLSPTNGHNGNDASRRVSRIRMEMEQELEERDNLPLESQSWFAGDLPVKTATDRLEALPVGTFLVRQRANGCFALMLKSPELPKGVKSMKIESKIVDGRTLYFLSQARTFASIAKMITYYRTRDLTENFNYDSLRGITLKTPYKDI